MLDRQPAILTFKNARLVLPEIVIDDAWLIVCKGKIDRFGRGRIPRREGSVIDLRGAFLSPGLIDIHVHGGGEADFMDGTLEAVTQVMRTHTRHGVTTLFPTTTTASMPDLLGMMDACRRYRTNWKPETGARLAGVHLYGPYFAPDKSGCHDRSFCIVPTQAHLQKLFGSPLIRIATCAAELRNAALFYRMAAEARCLITCGHSNASWNEMQRAFECGVRHVDHFWCAMSNVASVRARFGTPMQGSMLEYVLSNPRMSTEVIADGCHLAPELLAFAYQMKGAKRLCLVSDANRAVDCPPGNYRFGNARSGTWFTSDGSVGRAENGSLASSVRALDHMVRVMYRDCGGTLQDVIRMASLTPAALTGIARSRGSIARGKYADLVVLDDQLEVQSVYIGGKRWDAE